MEIIDSQSMYLKIIEEQTYIKARVTEKAHLDLRIMEFD